MTRCQLIVCPALLTETREALPSQADCDVRVVGQPPDPRGEEVQTVDVAGGIEAPSTCDDPARPGCPRCACSLLPALLRQSLGPQALLVTPGWLATWSNQGRPLPLQAERPARVTLLDTGLHPLAGSHLLDFAQALGAEPHVLPIGVDLLRARVELAVSQSQREQAHAVARQARQAAAAQAMALEVFGQLALLTSEERVIHGLGELFTTLFGAREIKYTPGEPLLGAPLAWGALDDPQVYAKWTAPQPWVGTQSGFIVRIDNNDRLLGTFELSGFTNPDALSDYVNLALTIAPAAGMAISNARAMRGILTICSYCRKIRNTEGDWRALESYVSEHSDARFSHGICSQCLTEHFSGD